VAATQTLFHMKTPSKNPVQLEFFVIEHSISSCTRKAMVETHPVTDRDDCLQMLETYK